MTWQLNRAQRISGQYGISVVTDANYRGTGESGVIPSTYYDFYKSGFKDAYVNARFLEGLDAYLDLQNAGVVGNQVTSQMRQSVETDFVRQFVQTSGNVLSWIGCSVIDGSGHTTCDPTSAVAPGQHPYDL